MLDSKKNKPNALVNILTVITIALLSLHQISAATITGKIYDLNFNLVNDVLVRITTIPEQTQVAADGSYSFFVLPGDYYLTVERPEQGDFISYAIENVTIVDDGTYTVDLVLIPDIEFIEEDMGLTEDELNFDIFDEIDKENKAKQNLRFILISVVILIVVIILGFVFFKRKKNTSHKSDYESSDYNGVQSDEKKQEIEAMHLEKPKQSQNKKELEAENNDEKIISSYDKDSDTMKILEFVKKNNHTTQKDIRKEFPLSEAKISLIVADLESQGKVRKIKKGRGNIVVYNKE